MTFRRTFWLLSLPTAILTAAEPPVPKFQGVTLDPKIQIGYGLAIADVDGDGKPDVLLADKRQFVWYRNPGPEKAREPGAWTKHLLAENLTEHDNVCIAARDLDGDGKCEIAVGAEWNPSDTLKSGAVFYLQPPADRTQPWEAIRLESRPTVHRMKWFEARPGKWALAMLPLHGIGNKNGEGEPASLLIYERPSDVHGKWPTQPVATGNLTHNFDILRENDRDILLVSSKIGVDAFSAGPAGEVARQSHLLPEPAKAGEDSAVSAFAGAGEVRQGRLGGEGWFAATVEPMHGNQLVVYRPVRPEDRGTGAIQRELLTDRLVEGHALAARDLLGLGQDQIVVGWRGKGAGSTTGVAIWMHVRDRWQETAVDGQGMACEDLQVGDLDGDGKLDVVASGRATKNVKIYFNDTPR